MIINKI